MRSTNTNSRWGGGGYTGTAGKSLKYRYYTSYSRSILKFKIRVGIIFAMNNYHYQW